MFKVDGYSLFTEEDHYENGCDPSTAQETFIPNRLVADTLDGLLQKIADEHGQPRQSFNMQACEEPNRIDLQYLVNSFGEPASINEIRAFNSGEKKLWAAIVSYYVYEYTETPVTLPLS